MNLSVVIPTLGGIQLEETIAALQNSSIRPMEILICMPESNELLADIDLFDNIKIIRTKKKAQVYQRVTGFIAAKGDFVLQLDDRVVVKNDAIEKLVYCLKGLDNKAAITATLLKEGTDQSVFSRGHNNIIRKFSDWIINGKIGYKPGFLTLSGLACGFDLIDKTQEKIETEWLPGACVLHRSENLITQDYFPFSGKAYSEDLIHSHLLRESGVKLYVCNIAIIYVRLITYPDSIIELYRQYRSTKYFVSLQRKRFLRLNLFYFLRLIQISGRISYKAILRTGIKSRLN